MVFGRRLPPLGSACVTLDTCWFAGKAKHKVPKIVPSKIDPRATCNKDVISESHRPNVSELGSGNEKERYVRPSPRSTGS